MMEALLALDPDEALFLAPDPTVAPSEVDNDLYEPQPGDADYVESGKAYQIEEFHVFGTVLRGGYEGARSCTGGPEAGTKNLMSIFLERFAGRGGKNLGIYNCRSVRGAATTSIHAEGRAGDHGCPIGNDWMQAWCDFLVAWSAELGIQCVIYNRRIWSSSFPDGWRKYTGLVPHTDHAHVEQTRHSAKTLTVARIREVLELATPKPRPTPPSTTRPLLQKGSQGNDVGDWQSYLARSFPAYRNESPVRPGVVLKVDNDFGDWTDAWTRIFQKHSGLTVDGKVGPATWRKAGFR